MQRVIDAWHSPSLNSRMEVVTYGHFGFPLLMFPTAAADYLEYERFYVIDAIKDSIEAGKVKVFSINSINRESWLNNELHPRNKALRQVQYNSYITGEVVPFIWNSWYNLGNVQRQAGRMQEAAESYRKVFEIDPNNFNGARLRVFGVYSPDSTRVVNPDAYRVLTRTDTGVSIAGEPDSKPDGMIGRAASMAPRR